GGAARGVYGGGGDSRGGHERTTVGVISHSVDGSAGGRPPQVLPHQAGARGSRRFVLQRFGADRERHSPRETIARQNLRARPREASPAHSGCRTILPLTACMIEVPTAHRFATWATKRPTFPSP